MVFLIKKFPCYDLQTLREETKLYSRIPPLLKIHENVISFNTLFIVKIKTDGKIHIKSWRNTWLQNEAAVPHVFLH